MTTFAFASLRRWLAAPVLAAVALVTMAQLSIAPEPAANSNADLQALPATYPGGIWRRGFAAAGDAPPLLFVPSGSACSLNSGNGDGGSQVKSADGKCWLAVFPATRDARWWGNTTNFFYADATSGSDANDCLSATGIGHGPCRTIQHTVDWALNNFASRGLGYTINLKGNFTNAGIDGPIWVGGFGNATGKNGAAGAFPLINQAITFTNTSGGSAVVDDPTAQTANCNTLTASAAYVVLTGAVQWKNGGTDCGGGGLAIGAFNAAVIEIQGAAGLAFGPAPFAIFHAEASILEFANAATLNLGTSQYVFQADKAGILEFDSPTFTCVGTQTYSGTINGFFGLFDGSRLWYPSTTTWTGCGGVTGNQAFLLASSIDYLQAAVFGSITTPIPGTIAPLLDSASTTFLPQPTVTVGTCTGLGTGGSPGCAVISGSGLSGIIQLTTGSSATGTTGTIPITISNGGVSGINVPCVFFPQDSGASWSTLAPLFWISVYTTNLKPTVSWKTSSGLPISQTLNVQYQCRPT